MSSQQTNIKDNNDNNNEPIDKEQQCLELKLSRISEIVKRAKHGISNPKKRLEYIDTIIHGPDPSLMEIEIYDLMCGDFPDVMCGGKFYKQFIELSERYDNHPKLLFKWLVFSLLILELICDLDTERLSDHHKTQIFDSIDHRVWIEKGYENLAHLWKKIDTLEHDGHVDTSDILCWGEYDDFNVREELKSIEIQMHILEARLNIDALDQFETLYNYVLRVEHELENDTIKCNSSNSHLRLCVGNLYAEIAHLAYLSDREDGAVHLLKAVEYYQNIKTNNNVRDDCNGDDIIDVDIFHGILLCRVYSDSVFDDDDERDNTNYSETWNTGIKMLLEADWKRHRRHLWTRSDLLFFSLKFAAYYIAEYTMFGDDTKHKVPKGILKYVFNASQQDGFNTRTNL